MRVINLEIKARCAHPEQVRGILRERQARFAGLDRQVDTYFRVPQGRLKLRQGKIENALIYYRRPNEEGPKASDVLLHQSPGPGLKEILAEALGVLVAVAKQREIYYLDNVKIHLDQVERLGGFVEIESAGDEHADRDRLLRQCRELMEAFGIREADLVAESYSDLLLRKNDEPRKTQRSQRGE